MTYEAATVTQLARDYLERVKTNLDKPHRWHRLSLGKGPSHCLWGWFLNTPMRYEREARLLAIGQVANKIRLLGVGVRPSTKYGGTAQNIVVTWNDEPYRRQRDVVALLNAVIYDFDVELAGSERAYLEAKAIVEAEMDRCGTDQPQATHQEQELVSANHH